MNAAAHRTDPQPTRDDRRRHGRLRCSRVHCRFAGEVQDMSASGLRLHLDRPSPVGVDERLTVVLGSPAGMVELKARVVWSKARNGGHDLGLEFGEQGSRTRAALFDLAWTGPDASGPLSSVGLSGIGG